MNLQAALEQRDKVEAFQRKHRIGLLTLLFTDMVGSTKLKQELGDPEAVGLIQYHHETVRQVLGRFNESDEIGTAGDSFFLVFARPSDAVRFALMLQAKLRALAQETRRPIADRIGLHIGEVLIEERPEWPKPKDLYGLQVDICARVMSLAEGQQILLTRSAFDNARQVLGGREIEGVKPLSWLNHGPYLLKGVEEPLEICEVGELGEAPLKPPSDSEKVHRYVSPDVESVLGWRPAVGQAVPDTQWVLEAKLGEGGFGEVWLGRHARLKEQRVFKFCFRADRVRALKREMMLFRVLRERVGEHSHIVRLLEVHLDQPPFYLEEEYVSGRDLRTWCEGQGGVDKVPLELRLEIVAQAADGLAAAHEAGIIHRDIKPGNILLSQPSTLSSKPSAKLTDFGIGHLVSSEYLAGLTATSFTQSILDGLSSSRTGTHLYMAPELLAGRAATVKSDLYALGVVLYQLLVEDFTRPVTTDWAEEIGDPLLKEDLRRCFAGKPEERFGNAAELAMNLRTMFERRAARAAAAKEACERRAPRVVSIAVLPFVNMSADPENEFLSDGIAEDLITALSRVPGLRVPGRTSCFAFKGKTQDLRAIGQMLNVDTVLEGSLRKSGNRLRISAQLINVADGFHIWSERYGREMADVFVVQDEITRSIVEALKVELAGGMETPIVNPQTGNTDAYQLYLRGRYFWKRRGTGLFKAIHYFELALLDDPSYALAYTGVADCYNLFGFYGHMPPTDAFPRAKAAAMRSLDLNDRLVEGLSSLGFTQFIFEWDWSAAEDAFQRAIKLNPNYVPARNWYARFLSAIGDFDHAIAEDNRALAIDPLSVYTNMHLGWILSSARRFDQAISQLLKALEMRPAALRARCLLGQAYLFQSRFTEAIAELEKARLDSKDNTWALATLGYAYGISGQPEKAADMLARLVSRAKGEYVRPTLFAQIYTGLGDKDQAIEWLQKAYAERDSWLVLMHTDPTFDRLRPDRRFASLMKSVGFE